MASTSAALCFARPFRAAPRIQGSSDIPPENGRTWNPKPGSPRLDWMVPLVAGKRITNQCPRCKRSGSRVCSSHLVKPDICSAKRSQGFAVRIVPSLISCTSESQELSTDFRSLEATSAAPPASRGRHPGSKLAQQTAHSFREEGRPLAVRAGCRGHFLASAKGDRFSIHQLLWRQCYARVFLPNFGHGDGSPALAKDAKLSVGGTRLEIEHVI